MKGGGDESFGGGREARALSSPPRSRGSLRLRRASGSTVEYNPRESTLPPFPRAGSPAHGVAIAHGLAEGRSSSVLGLAAPSRKEDQVSRGTLSCILHGCHLFRRPQRMPSAIAATHAELPITEILSPLPSTRTKPCIFFTSSLHTGFAPAETQEEPALSSARGSAMSAPRRLSPGRQKQPLPTCTKQEYHRINTSNLRHNNIPIAIYLHPPALLTSGSTPAAAVLLAEPAHKATRPTPPTPHYYHSHQHPS